MKKYLYFTLLFFTLCFYGCSDDIQPIEVSEGIDTVETGEVFSDNYNIETVKTIVIVARIDNVKIERIKLNKGNCGVKNFKPKTIKYGEEVSYITNCQNLLNAAIGTDKGEWEFNW
jgi:hypothetical protein|nr:hypothetical protein [uncultured Campylobacter sp.]